MYMSSTDHRHIWKTCAHYYGKEIQIWSVITYNMTKFLNSEQFLYSLQKKKVKHYLFLEIS